MVQLLRHAGEKLPLGRRPRLRLSRGRRPQGDPPGGEAKGGHEHTPDQYQKEGSSCIPARTSHCFSSQGRIPPCSILVKSLPASSSRSR
ncbi:hypothetical protein Daudx_1718 [Candidatus Desulforudis audaxviator]|nr:hypothetical protein Daudx_1718 [Candidatus Desulforudis audaxviator]